MKNTIDEIDSQIIRLLQKNGRMPNTELAKKIGIAEATVRKHLRRLLSENIIQVVAVGNPMKLGFEIAGNIKLQIDLKMTEPIIEELNKIDCLWYIGRMTGPYDIDIEFNVNSNEKLCEIIDNISKIDGVIKIEHAILLQILRNTYDWGTSQNYKRLV
jgi:Lrp/AsnC family transcriptional regulator for asnA, asnC and gidA